MTASRLQFIDSHAHLDSEQFEGVVEDVVTRARQAGIVRVVNIGYRPVRWQSTIELADRFPEIAVTFGLHPHHAEEWSDATERSLRDHIERFRPVAIGEIGLDFNRNLNSPDRQADVFSQQLRIAQEYDLPVVIHQRDAEDALLTILRKAPKSLECVLHSFEGSTKLASLAVDRGYFLGVGGLMTRARSSDLREVLRTVPVELLLLETDSPYLVPAKLKQRRNEPANLVHIAESFAGLLRVSLSDLAEVTTRNARRAFKLQTTP